MNDWDKNNFEYMQSLSPEQFDKWMLELSEDDVDYAVSLYQRARVELDVKTAEIFDEVDDLEDAQAVLKRIAINARPNPF